MLFVWGVLVRLSPDSACTKNAIANTIASQKIPRTAFNLFILYSFFCAPAFWFFVYIETKPRLTLCDSVPAMLRSSFQKRQAESLSERGRNLSNLQEKR
jgi:hypothetical protein